MSCSLKPHCVERACLERLKTPPLLAVCARIVVALSLVASLHAQTAAANGIRIVTDRTTYNAGSTVRVRVVATGEKDRGAPLDLTGTLRYEGVTKAILDHVPLASSFATSGAERSTEYREFWRIPPSARTGRYEIDLQAVDPSSHKPIFETDEHAASFAVHRKIIQIERIDLDRTFFTSGDPVAATVQLKNTGDHAFAGLRVEFSKRHWPWTAQSAQRQGVDYETLASALALPPGAAREVRSARAAVVETVKQPTVAQYAVVVWDHARAHVLDIAFTSIVFVNPPGVRTPRPYAGPPGYPMQYLHPDLNSINTTNYRHFYPPELDSPAIRFDTTHTMFPAGGEGAVDFTVRDPASSPWHGASLSVKVTGVAPPEILNADEVTGAVDLEPGAPPVAKRVRLRSSGSAAGLDQVEVQLRDSSGAILASNTLELGFNPLPESMLIFCAHPDDEGAHSGPIRAAVENHIPIHFVYFTSGDAGSCDRYYQRFCGPAEALNFGALRMDEARASVGHLGVPPEAVEFFGLPDGGSGEVWNHVAPSNPYLSVLLAVDHASYDGLVAPNLPYARDAVVEKVKGILRRFKPAVIYTGHPDERHVDHRTNNWFVVKAMQQLLAEGGIKPDTVLLTDQSYGPGPQAHAPYRYQKNVFYVSGEAMALAQESAWYYQSQGGNTAEGRLRTFDKLRTEQVHWQILDWQQHAGWNESH